MYRQIIISTALVPWSGHFAVVKYKYTFQKNIRNLFYQAALGNCYGSKLPQCREQLENKFIASFVKFFGIVSFPMWAESVAFLFLGTHLYGSDPSTDFHARWLKRRGLAQSVPNLGGFVDIAPHLGVKSPPKPSNPNFWGVNMRFQAKRAKY